MATAFATSNAAEFVVADAGIGIRRSIAADDDREALRMAIAEGVARDRTRNAGNGLFGSYRVAVLLWSESSRMTAVGWYSSCARRPSRTSDPAG